MHKDERWDNTTGELTEMNHASNSPEERCAIVTGASRGIGRGIALELARRGCNIAINGVSADPAQMEKGAYAVEREIQEMGRKTHVVRADISKAEDRERLVQETLEKFGRIDLLVNNAGVAPKARKDILETEEESFDRLIHINLRGPFFLTQRVAREMVKQVETGTPHRPVVVFVTSISAATPSPSRPEYCISKAGLSMASTLYASRLIECGIHVYEVRPGIIATDMTSVVKEKYDKLIGEGLVPQKRWGTPEDIGRLVAAMANGDFGYAPGAIVEASGGMQIQPL